MRGRPRWLWVPIVVSMLVIGVPPGPAAWSSGSDDTLRQRLEAIPGMVVESESRPAEGYQFFVLAYRQPVDHHHPENGTFMQRLTLLHTSFDRPMVFDTSGYGFFVPPAPNRTELTRLVGGNQIVVEHRFFMTSVPERPDWNDLDIWQEASDEHRIVTALRPLYPRPWLGAGASKGGMTQVYHAYYYRHDLDGVLAYVAPDDARDEADEPYERFLDRVGTASCRSALADVQRVALGRDRDALRARFVAWARAHGRTFDQVFGTADRAFELGVLDARWTFWQYATASSCASIPSPTADVDTIYAWLDAVEGLGFFTDQYVIYYAPYYYQAATQLGWAYLRFDDLRDVTRYCRPASPGRGCGIYQANSYLPPALRSRYRHPSAVAAVSRWVRKRGSRMMFVYGQNDPYSAPGKRFTPSTRDSYRFVAPGGNHGTTLAQLTPADRAEATAVLRRWSGLPAAGPVTAGPRVPALDHTPGDAHRRVPPDPMRPRPSWTG